MTACDGGASPGRPGQRRTLGGVRSMPAVLEVILFADRRRPDPPPVRVDMRRVFVVGIAAWLVVLAVLTVLWRMGVVDSTPVWSCVAGATLGVVGLVWERTRGDG